MSWPWSRFTFVVLAATTTVALSGCSSSADQELDGIQFQSRAGEDTKGDLPWITDHPVWWSMTTVDGEYTAIISPPCAMVQVPVDVSATEIHLDMDRASIAAVACEEPIASMDAWVHTFISEPITYTWDNDVLSMTNDNGALTFERAEPTPSSPHVDSGA